MIYKLQTIIRVLQSTEMAHTAKIFQPIRFMESLTSIIYHSRSPFYGKFQPLKTWMKGLQIPGLHIRPPIFHWRLYTQKFLHMPNFCNSGRECSMGTAFGVSFLLGSVSLWPRISYSMDGFDILVDDHRVGSLGDSESEEDPLILLTFTRKLLVPVFLFFTVWMTWGRPMILAAKVFLVLLSTKPSPFSVYIFVEQLRQQFLRQHPILYKFKSLYAKKVEVEDYTFLCVARIELQDQKFTLIGILGSWWVFQLTPFQRAFSAFQDRVLKTFLY